MNLWESAKQYVRGGIILTDWLYGGTEVVPIEQAQERSNICRVCIHNQESPVTEFVANAIKEQTKLKDDLGVKIEGSEELNTCQICSCSLGLKIHVPMNRIKPSESELAKFPSFCWVSMENK